MARPKTGKRGYSPNYTLISSRLSAFSHLFIDMGYANCQAEQVKEGVAMTINARLTSLQRQHVELEDEIRSRQADLSEDTLDIWTLKRKKLALKEQIEALREQA
jgi:hypothetical protein